MSVEAANVVILVFAMPGCPACHEFLPRLRRQAQGFQKLGHPILEYEAGSIARRGQIPIVIVDSTSQDPSVVSLADRYQVSALPTTLLIVKNGFPGRWEGALSEDDTYHLLNAAVASNR